MKGQPPCRDGRVHVMREKCATCIFRPGNLMDLQEGRLKGMVSTALRRKSAIICHETLDGPRAVCSGFYDAYPTAPLRVAVRLGLITWVDR